jgi:hypothetical protein
MTQWITPPEARLLDRVTSELAFSLRLQRRRLMLGAIVWLALFAMIPFTVPINWAHPSWGDRLAVVGWFMVLSVGAELAVKAYRLTEIIRCTEEPIA